MKTKIMLCLLLFFCWSMPASIFAQTDSNSPKPTTKLRVMSFNIRNGRAKDGENKWDNRKEFVCDVVKHYSLDVVGLQEAFHFQLKYMLENLPEFSSIGEGRDGGEKGEYSAILIRKNRFDVQESGTFWLSDTPQKKSKSWGNRYLRICTWARLKDKRNNRSFYVFNTHFDHQSQNARLQSARLIAKRITQRESPDPFVFMGDLNAGEDNQVIKYLKGEDKSEKASEPHVQLQDTFRVLNPDAKEVGTGCQFIGRKSGPKIDYILVPETCKTHRASIIHVNRSGKYPSDHFPVFAEIEFTSSSAEQKKKSKD